MPILADHEPYKSPTSLISLSWGERVGVRAPGKHQSLEGALKQQDKEFLACDVSLYFQLYNEVLIKTQGNHDLAKKSVFEAAKRDGGALIQESISALNDNGQPIFDLEYRARMQLTPTVNTYHLYQQETFNQDTGEKVITKKMTSPEHQVIGRDVTEALSPSWRRGNDYVSMTQNRDIFVNFDQKFDRTKPHMKFWGSPIAEKSEGEVVHGLQGEYGYIYAAFITPHAEASARKEIVYSFKNDLTASQYELFFNKLNGQEFFAGYDRINNPETDPIDKAMRTTIMMEGVISPEQIWRRLFDVKRETTGETTMFGIPEQTLLDVQDSELRQRLEDEASTEVALWLVSKMRHSNPSDIQDLIKDKYIQATQKTLDKIKEVRKTAEKLQNMPQYHADGSSIINEGLARSVNLEDLAKMKANEGKACGSWGGSSSTKIESSSQQLAKALSGYTTFSAPGWSGGGSVSLGGSSESSEGLCKDCGKRPALEKGCGWCEPCGNNH